VKFFLCVIGMVMIVEGLPYFAFPDKMKATVQMILTLDAAILRRVGFFLMISGLALVYLAMGAN